MMQKAIFGFGALALLLPAPAQSQDAAGGDWAGIVQCAAIGRADERHACMDEVIRRAGLLSEARVTQAAREDFGNENRAEPVRAAPPVAVAAAPPAAAAVPSTAPLAPARAADLDKLATTVVSAQVRGDRRLVVTTAEGSVWEQTQSETFRNAPKTGNPFSIERTSLGGFRCSFERSTHYRCRRID
jgi:hypothetical protein